MATTTTDTTTTSEPILSRVERLDLMMSYLEEIKGNNNNSRVKRNSCASTTSSGGSITSTTDDGGGNLSVNSTPKSVENRCKPMEDVVVETRVKGSLIERVDQLETKLLQLEEDIEKEKRREADESDKNRKHRKQKGLKTFVKSCIKGDIKTKE